MSFDRYKYTEQYKKNNKRSYRTTIYPKVEKSASDIYIYATKGDRLDLIAFDYYDGDQTLWPIIANANNIGKGTLVVDTGKQIRIPMNIDEYKKNLKDEYNNR